MEMNLTNQMQMSQQMKLTPAMMQSMEILQLPITALEQRIESELNNNPVLELDTLDDELPPVEDGTEYLNKSLDEKELNVSDSDTAKSFERLENLGNDFKEYVNQDASVSVRYDDGEEDPKTRALNNTADNHISMQEYLKEQLVFSDAAQQIVNVANIIIDHLDSKGYLPISLKELAAMYDGFEPILFEKALELVQSLEPAGIGARNVRECLLIQLKQNPAAAAPYALEIVEDYYEMLLYNHLPQLAKKLECSMENIKDALEYLGRLDTSPGTQFSSGFDNAPVRVDIIVDQADNGELIVELANSNLPSLRINNEYEAMIAAKNIDKDTKQYLQENLRNAKWIIDAVNQRQQTLLKIASVAVSHQKEFFKNGKLALKPLFMQEVADKIGMHVATVSRAVAGKYMQTPQGQIPLRELFTTRVVSESGNVKGTDAIKQALQNIIDKEDKSKPYSDDVLSQMLTEKGYEISRRTVVKYRDQMGIPASRIRKKFD